MIFWGITFVLVPLSVSLCWVLPVLGNWEMKRIKTVHHHFYSFHKLLFSGFPEIVQLSLPFHIPLMLVFIKQEVLQNIFHVFSLWVLELHGISPYLAQSCTVQDNVAQIFTLFLTELAQIFLVFVSHSVFQALGICLDSKQDY